MDNLENVPLFSMMPNISSVLDEEALLKIKSGTADRSDLIESVMQTTPLKQIGKGISMEWEDPIVPRYNGQRAQTVMCSPSPGIETEKARATIAERIEQIKLPEGYQLQWKGRKRCQYANHALLVQKRAVGYRPDDCHPYHAVQGLPQACNHTLLRSIACHRYRRSHASKRTVIHVLRHCRGIGTGRHDDEKLHRADG